MCRAASWSEWWLLCTHRQRAAIVALPAMTCGLVLGLLIEWAVRR